MIKQSTLLNGMNKLHKIALFIETDTQSDRVFLFTIKALGFFLLFIALSQFSLVEMYYGPTKFIPDYPYEGNVLSLPLHILDYLPQLAWVFYIGYIISLILLLWKADFWVALSCFILHFNLYHTAYLVQNGGDMLVNLILIFTCIYWSKSNLTLKNLALWLVRTQIALLYLVSSLYKLESGGDWLNGEAIFLMKDNLVFGPDLFQGLNKNMYAVLCYIVLSHQILFPVLIWFKKIKFSVIILGMLIHLGIAFILGLFDFGIIMCLSYLFFLNNRELDMLKRVLRFTRQTKASHSS